MAKDERKKHSGGMGSRGVARPMDMHSKGHSDDSENDDQQMDQEQRKQMLHMHHQKTLWIYWMLVLLGVLLVLSPSPSTTEWALWNLAGDGRCGYL